jgi:hypothetical protein
LNAGFSINGRCELPVIHMTGAGRAGGRIVSPRALAHELRWPASGCRSSALERALELRNARNLAVFEARPVWASSGGTLPIAAMTARVSGADRVRAFRVAVQAYLVKPVDPVELVKTVRWLATVTTR